MPRDVLLVKIQNALADGQSLYEATRQSWKISQTGLSDIKYVVGISGGRVVSAYEPTTWHLIDNEEAEVPEDVGRNRFDGDEAPSEVMLKFQRAKRLLLSKFGQGAAIAYASLEEIDSYG